MKFRLNLVRHDDPHLPSPTFSRFLHVRADPSRSQLVVFPPPTFREICLIINTTLRREEAGTGRLLLPNIMCFW